MEHRWRTVTAPRLLLLSQAVDVVRQVVPVHLHPGPLVGELVHLAPQLPHLVLVQIRHPGRAFAPQLLQLRQQDLVLLLQEAHLVDVAGEAVVERLHLRLLVGAVREEVAVDGVGQGEVQVLGGQPGHGRAAPEPLRLGRVNGRRGGEAVGHPGGAHRAGELAAGVAPRRDPLSAEHLLVGRVSGLWERHVVGASSDSQCAEQRLVLLWFWSGPCSISTVRLGGRAPPQDTLIVSSLCKWFSG